MIRNVLVLAFVALVPSAALAGYKVYDKDDQTLELGLRMQARAEASRIRGFSGGTEWQRDFMLRRARLKANGKLQGVSFGLEWKIDGTDQIGVSPSAQVENAWMQYPLRAAAAQVRAGLFDAPFSRDLLTSDSKQLAVDRGAVSAIPSALGLVDNVVGFDLRGGVKEGHYQYAVGMYDNRVIPGRAQGIPMLAGRVDLNLASTKDIYQDAHFGTDKWYCLGLNGSVQSSIDGFAHNDSLTMEAAGADGMLDIPAGRGRLMLRGEINAIRLIAIGPVADKNSTVRMVGLGYLMMRERVQPFVRFDQVRGDVPQGWRLAGAGATAPIVTRDITYVGANFYQKGHNLKFQGDLLFLSGNGESLDGGRLQAQIDF